MFAVFVESIYVTHIRPTSTDCATIAPVGCVHNLPVTFPVLILVQIPLFHRSGILSTSSVGLVDRSRLLRLSEEEEKRCREPRQYGSFYHSVTGRWCFARPHHLQLHRPPSLPISTRSNSLCPLVGLDILTLDPQPSKATKSHTSRPRRPCQTWAYRATGSQ